MGLAGAAVADDQDVLVVGDVLAAHQLADQGLVDGRLAGEVERVEGLDHRQAGRLQPAVGGAALAIEQLPFGQPQQVGRVVGLVLPAGGGHRDVLAQDGRQLQRFEVVLQQHRRLRLVHDATSPTSRSR